MGTSTRCRVYAGTLWWLLMVMSLSAAADWAQLSPEELASQSVLIVVGECLGQERVQLTADGPVINLGVLRVESVLKGDAGRTMALLLLPPSRPGGLVSSTDVFVKKGQRGLWYLKHKSEGLYQVDRPDRFVAMDAAESRIRAWQGAR